jgi:hypothetical protein
MSLTKYLSLTDNARDAVLLHVSASSKEQERGDKTGITKKIMERQIIKLSDVYGSAFFYFYLMQKSKANSTLEI